MQSISESEWIIMDLLWDENPQTAKDIIERLKDKKEWNHRTVKTLLSRLVKKEVLTFTQEGRLYKYFPVVDRDNVEKKERKSFIDKLYKGAVSPMLAAFINESKLSKVDIKNLKELLDQKESEIED